MTDNYRIMENPYLSARKEYSDRYGSAVKDAAHWRQISVIMLLLCLAFGATMIWLTRQHKVAPYVVQVDEHASTIVIKPSENWGSIDQRAIVAALCRFFVNFKTVTADAASQTRIINDVYAYLEQNSAAANIVLQYYKKHDPYVAVKKKQEPTVQVKITNIRYPKKEGESWQIYWSEEKMNNGSIIETKNWYADVYFNVSPVRGLEEVIKNPFGILITGISMHEEGIVQ